MNWGYYKSQIENMIRQKMDQEDIDQGDKFDYLQGKALKKFEI